MDHKQLKIVLERVTKTLEGVYTSEVELTPISADNYWEIIRNKERFRLNWQHYMPRFFEKRDSFHFVVKPKEDSVLLSGVVGYYEPSTKQLFIGILEHFDKTQDNPVKGSLIRLMAMTSAYFLIAVEGDECVVLEPLPEVVPCYHNVGFDVSKRCPKTSTIEEMSASPMEIITALTKT